MKRYNVLSPDGTRGVVELEPHAPASNAKTVSILNLLISTAAGQEAMDDAELALFAIALDNFGVTNDEALTAFWPAFSDPYVSQNRIHFRHLWKYISAKRSELITYTEVLKRLEPGQVLSERFEAVQQPNGENLWRERG